MLFFQQIAPYLPLQLSVALFLVVSLARRAARTSWLNAIYTTSPQCLASTCSR